MLGCIQQYGKKVTNLLISIRMLWGLFFEAVREHRCNVEHDPSGAVRTIREGGALWIDHRDLCARAFGHNLRPFRRGLRVNEDTGHVQILHDLAEFDDMCCPRC